MNKKVGVYVRVSTEEQAKEGISLDAQVQRCKSFCDARGWKVYQIYTDAGFSAGSMKRPALTNLLKDIDEKKIDVLLVYKIDRFSRNLKDLISLLDDLKKKEVNFTSVTEQIDTTTAMGEAFFQIIGVFAQLERGMVKERVEMAFDKKISSGEVLNRAPLGYLYKNKRLVVDTANAENVKQIFGMWVAGVNYKEISSKFGIPVSTLYEIVKNPTYIGKVKYRGKLYPGSHKSIIAESLFYQINNQE
jgi:site-specific DNA recombinase